MFLMVLSSVGKPGEISNRCCQGCQASRQIDAGLENASSVKAGRVIT